MISSHCDGLLPCNRLTRSPRARAPTPVSLYVSNSKSWTVVDYLASSICDANSESPPSFIRTPTFLEDHVRRAAFDKHSPAVKDQPDFTHRSSRSSPSNASFRMSTSVHPSCKLNRTGVGSGELVAMVRSPDLPQNKDDRQFRP